MACLLQARVQARRLGRGLECHVAEDVLPALFLEPRCLAEEVCRFHARGLEHGLKTLHGVETAGTVAIGATVQLKPAEEDGTKFGSRAPQQVAVLRDETCQEGGVRVCGLLWFDDQRCCFLTRANACHVQRGGDDPDDEHSTRHIEKRQPQQQRA